MSSVYRSGCHFLSVIVPVLDEADGIAEFLKHLRERVPDAEIIVVDGGSTDETRDLARCGADRMVMAPRGRARQMNAGASIASGEVLWFLHADSRLPVEPLGAIRKAFQDSRLVGGCFRLRIPHPALIYRVSDSLGNIGVDWFRIALGDHGLFCRKSVFVQVGGYPEVPLMEDAEFYRLMRKAGRVRQLPDRIETSPRRYERHGPYRTTLAYALILALYAGRVSPSRLLAIYRKLCG